MRRTVGIAAACVTAMATPAAAFSATFSWRGIPACSSVSPAFAVSGAPAGTAALRFAMRDADAPGFRHGGSSVPFAGHGRVPRGAIAYAGPCPPPAATHLYVWSVEAVDARGSTLAAATATGRFPER